MSEATIQTVDLMRDGLQILQDPRRFCFGIDAVLLSGFVPPDAAGRLLDLGTGTGILPILLSAKTACTELVGLEIQPESAALAARSAELNGLSGKVSILEGDLRQADTLFAPASFDVVTANPPYFERGRGKCDPADPRAIARHEILCTFQDVAAAAAHALKKGGRFYLVHRPERLPAILAGLTAQKLTPRRLRLIHPFAAAAANLFLLDCERGAPAGAGLTVEPPLVVYREQGVYTDEVLEIYGMK